MADVFAELQGAHSPPELLAFKLRKVVNAQAREILLLDRGGWLPVDPILKLVCQEFPNCPRKDWAAQISAFHEKQHVGKHLGLKGLVRETVSEEPELPDLDLAVRPHNLQFNLEPGGRLEFVFDPLADIRWRWRATWHLLVRCAFANRTTRPWGTGLGDWDIKRVSLDEIARDDSLRWKPQPSFTRENRSGYFLELLVIERESAA